MGDWSRVGVPDPLSVSEAKVTGETLITSQDGPFQTLSAGSWVKLEYSLVNVDDRGEWDDTNHTWTPDKGGVYLVTVSARFAQSGNTGDRIMLEFNSINRNDQLAYFNKIREDAQPVSLTGAFLIKPTAGTSYAVYARNDSSTDEVQGGTNKRVGIRYLFGGN